MNSLNFGASSGFNISEKENLEKKLVNLDGLGFGSS